MRAVLDTSVLIAGGTRPLVGELAISAVSLTEIELGVRCAGPGAVRDQRLALLVALRRSFDALPVDEAVAASYGVLASAVTKAGRQPWARSLDLLIAATAHAHGALVYTCNPAELLGLEDVLEVVAV